MWQCKITDKGIAALEKGFTLLEVLLAMVIVGIGLTAATELFSGSMRLAHRAGRHTLLTFLADAKLNEASTLFAQTDSTALSGVFEGDFSSYHWVLQKTEPENSVASSLDYADDEQVKAVPELSQITVILTWDERGKERHFRLSTYQSDLLKTDSAG